MVFKCKICGGNLDVQKDSKIVTCEYCGTKQTLPKLENDRTTNLYDRANHFRRNHEYDKAEALYEMILNEDSKDAEAYWSLILCKFGVDYVEDPKTHEYIPTCNRTQNTSILADENYKQALKYASEEQKELYKIEAEKINSIQKGILEISSKEEPYDVFICYKETDENGERTHDSVIAQDIYDKLIEKGYKVFFAKITLENKIGESYEPYIFAALNSAKVMLVIGTKKEHFNAVWVKNEWSRFLTLIKDGEKKVLIPCFKGITAYDLPEEFMHLQAQDMNKVGAEQDLIHGIKKLVNTETEEKKTKKLFIITIIAIIVMIAISFIIVNNKLNSQESNKKTEESAEAVQNEKDVEEPILREEMSAPSGYTFDVKAEDLKNQILETAKNAGFEDMIKVYELDIPEYSGTCIGIGWTEQTPLGIGADIYDENTGEELSIVGIKIYSESSLGLEKEHGYVTSITCNPTAYGSGDMTPLTVPTNLYEKAKKILGRETEEWSNFVNKGRIQEKTYDMNKLNDDMYSNDVFEEVTDGSFCAGMYKSLDIK